MTNLGLLFCQSILKGSEDVFELEEEVAGLGEGIDDLGAVGVGGGTAQLVANTVEGVAAVAREMVDLLEEGDIVCRIIAAAFLVLVGLEGGELGLPIPEKGGIDAEKVGDLADGVVKFFCHINRCNILGFPDKTGAFRI